MSFRADARRVRNTDLPIWYRLVAFRSSLERFFNGYTETLKQLDEEFGFNRNRPRTDPPTEIQLIGALDAAERINDQDVKRYRKHCQEGRLKKTSLANANRLASRPEYFVAPGITESDFYQKISSGDSTVVFFRASWYELCVTQAVLLRRSLKKSSVHVVFLDAEMNPNFDLYQSLKLVTVPTILCFQNGVELGRKAGFTSETQLVTWWNDLGFSFR